MTIFPWSRSVKINPQGPKSRKWGKISKIRFQRFFLHHFRSIFPGGFFDPAITKAVISILAGGCSGSSIVPQIWPIWGTAGTRQPTLPKSGKIVKWGNHRSRRLKRTPLGPLRCPQTAHTPKVHESALWSRWGCWEARKSLRMAFLKLLWALKITTTPFWHKGNPSLSISF